jgi:SAUR family protein
MQREEKRGKVKKGWLAVRVGDEHQRRFIIPIAYLYHPLFCRLLEAARDAYGYGSSGPLRLPCSVDEFLRLRALVERDTHSSSSSHRVHAGHLAPCTRAKVMS